MPYRYGIPPGFHLLYLHIYTGLYENESLLDYRQHWWEPLGDLACYRIAAAAITSGSSGHGPALTAANVPAAADSAMDTDPPADAETKPVSDACAARIDGSPSPSVGISAARALEFLPEKD